MGVWVLIAAIASALTVEAWYPFGVRFPVWTRSAPERSALGIVTFDGSSLLKSRDPQPWVDAARRTGRLQVRLDLRSRHRSQSGPARVLTVSRDYSNGNLMVG